MMLSVVKVIKRYEKELISFLTREFFTKELVFNASALVFPDNSLSSFTNFPLEQLNLEGQTEVAISEISYQSMYQNVTEEKTFFNKKTLKFV